MQELDVNCIHHPPFILGCETGRFITMYVSLPQVPILSQMYPVHTLVSHFPKM
jgi:hypothetical protein